MYIHPINRWEEESEILDFIRQNAFATIVSTFENKPQATHLPLVLDRAADGTTILSGHLAKANSQWKNLSPNSEVLAIFQGPHAYISSSWYTHENVPTWNYQAIHVYGKIRLIEGEELMAHLSKLVDTYEEGRPNRVHVAKMTEGYLQSQLRALVGFEIRITEVQASAKLSQNRDEENYQRIISHLEASEVPMDREVAGEMKKIQKKKFGK